MCFVVHCPGSAAGCKTSSHRYSTKPYHWHALRKVTNAGLDLAGRPWVHFWGDGRSCTPVPVPVRHACTCGQTHGSCSNLRKTAGPPIRVFVSAISRSCPASTMPQSSNWKSSSNRAAFTASATLNRPCSSAAAMTRDLLVVTSWSIAASCQESKPAQDSSSTCILHVWAELRAARCATDAVRGVCEPYAICWSLERASTMTQGPSLCQVSVPTSTPH